MTVKFVTADELTLPIEKLKDRLIKMEQRLADLEKRFDKLMERLAWAGEEV